MMKLAMITPDGIAHCLCCTWQLKAPSKRRVRHGTTHDLTTSERQAYLEQSILSHLRDSHDRMLVTRDTCPRDPDVVGLDKVFYNGRRITRS